MKKSNHQDSVLLFLDYLRYEKNYSANTIKAYQRDLNEFISQSNTSINEVKDSDLQKLMLAVITEEEETIDPKD